MSLTQEDAVTRFLTPHPGDTISQVEAAARDKAREAREYLYGLDYVATDAVADPDPAEAAVELILQLRHDRQDHREAVVLLRGIRPDLPVQSIECWVYDLLAASSTAADAVMSGPRAHADCAAEQYERLLCDFARRPRSAR